jgi:hypothetical protein
MKVSFPDICEFPEAGDSLFPESINTADFYQAMDNAINALDAGSFTVIHNQLINSILSKSNPLTAQEQQILQEQTKRIQQFVHNYCNYKHNREISLNEKPNPITADLNRDGVHAFKFSDDLIIAINRHLEPHINRLHSTPDHIPGRHEYDRAVSFRPNDNEHLFTLLSSAYAPFMGPMVAHKGINVRLSMVTLHLSKPTDLHHDRTLRDMKTTSKLLGLHMDPKFNVMKSLLYLSEVDEDAGPFMAIPGSNQWEYDMVERLVACGNSTGNYLDSPAHRKVLRMMPKRLRGNAIFGRYILDGTELSDKLLAAEKHYLTTEYNAMIFNPAETMHRGGMCTKKDRLNLQIIFK